MTGPSGRTDKDYRSSDRYLAGLDVIIRTGGRVEGIQQWAAAHPFVGPRIDRMLGEFCFGDVWTESTLDDRTKRLLTLAILGALGAEMPLRAHIASALDQGLSQEEVLEVFVHLVAYAGFPRALTAIDVANEVFGERTHSGASQEGC